MSESYAFAITNPPLIPGDILVRNSTNNGTVVAYSGLTVPCYSSAPTSAAVGALILNTSTSSLQYYTTGGWYTVNSTAP